MKRDLAYSEENEGGPFVFADVVKLDKAAFAELGPVCPENWVAGSRMRQAMWAETEAAIAAAEREARSGLVSVPTTVQGAGLALSKEFLSDELIASNLDRARKDCLAEVGAFVVDTASRRLSSLRCAVGVAARAHAVSEKGHRSDKPWMVTLTYRPGVSWAAEHVSQALRKARAWCKKRGQPWRYLWIAEIQDGKRREDGQGRDVIHYHLVIWLPVGVRAPHFDTRGWWPHGMSQSILCRHAVGYLMSYLKKDKNLAAMPKGARAYGVGGLDHSLRRARRWLRLPRFVQGNSSIHDGWARAAGGGWTSPGGEWFQSEFRPVVCAGVRALLRVARHETVIEAAGPFSWITDRARALSLVH